jgi:hypothetical protein
MTSVSSLLDIVFRSLPTFIYPEPKKKERPDAGGIRGVESLRGEDLNLRPSGYEPDELPDCSTPLHHEWLEIAITLGEVNGNGVQQSQAVRVHAAHGLVDFVGLL